MYLNKQTSYMEFLRSCEIVRNNSAINSFTIDMIDKYKEVLLNSKLIVSQLKVPVDVSDYLINFCYENNLPIIVTPCNPEKLSIDLILVGYSDLKI